MNALPRFAASVLAGLGFALMVGATNAADTSPLEHPTGPSTVRLRDVRLRDACVLPHAETQTYIMVASARGARVQAFTSKDLVHWEGPHIIWETPPHHWDGAEIRSIWAPELHAYKGKYYLFLTFSTSTRFPEQWRSWLPRVKRASQILVADAPLGPYRAFASKPTLPEDMMTLDGTLWVEDDVPYMVYCHEWVQIVNGTVEKVQLTDDPSATVGDTVRLFWGNDAPWSKRSD